VEGKDTGLAIAETRLRVRILYRSRDRHGSGEAVLDIPPTCDSGSTAVAAPGTNFLWDFP
jgi:hypothetical protein